MSPSTSLNTPETARILIVDDDRDLCALLADYLRQEGFGVETLHDGASLLARLQSSALTAPPPDLVILDVMMPGPDGLETLRLLRQTQALPVIMLSARGEPVDRVVGLEFGADDYLAKPCLPRELLARVRARLRRNVGGAAAMPADTLEIGDLRLHPSERRAWLGAAELHLTGAEFSLLYALAARAGQLIDKATLTRAALGRELERFDRSVDVHVSRLRRKLSEAGPQAPQIESVRGLGYQMLVAPERRA